jgi:DNA-binding transcriptional LysR family regulator
VELGRFDLNLLVAFDAVMRERSVLRASRQLNLTQSAVSHALGRLRHLLGDDLFLRDPAGMRPTPRALELAGPVADALALLRRGLAPEQFDPAGAAGTVTIAATDYVAVALLPRFLSALRQSAPGMTLQIFPLGRLDLVAQMDSGRVDLAVSWFEQVPARFRRMQLAADREALVVRRGHPLAEGVLTLDRLLTTPHVAVDLTGLGEAGDSGFIDDRGLRRRTRIERLPGEHAVPLDTKDRAPTLTVPSYLMIPDLLARSEMVATLPRRLAIGAAQRHDLVLLDPPFDYPAIRLDAVWHEMHDNSAVHRWVRGLLAAAAGDPALPS